MPENPTPALVKTAQSPALARVSNQLALTDKLLTKPEEPFLIPYRKGNKWGFCDRNKNIVIDCVYDGVNFFSEGLAAVYTPKWEGQWNTVGGGFIDIRGNHVIPPIYKGVSSFSEGLAAVQKEGLRGYVNKNGEVCIPHQYIQAKNFSNGLAVVGKHNCHKEWSFLHGIIDKSGIEVEPMVYDSISGITGKIILVKSNDIYHYIQKSNFSIISNQDDIEMGFNFFEGLAAFRVDNKWGFINETGDITIPPTYDDPGLFYFEEIKFSEGLSAVLKNDKWGFIDAQANVLIPFLYKKAYAFSEGLARVKRNSWGFIDKNGYEIISTNHDSVQDFSHGLAAFENKGRWGFMNHLGQVVIEPKYGSVREFSNDLSLVNGGIEPGMHGYIDKRGIEYWEE